MKLSIPLAYAPRNAQEALGLFSLSMVGKHLTGLQDRVISHIETRRAKVVSVQTISSEQAAIIAKQYERAFSTCLK